MVCRGKGANSRSRTRGAGLADIPESSGLALALFFLLVLLFQSFSGAIIAKLQAPMREVAKSYFSTQKHQYSLRLIWLKSFDLPARSAAIHEADQGLQVPAGPA